MQNKNFLTIYADGGARRNPGPAAIGYSIIQNGKEIAAHGQYIGKATNNQAEHKAVLAALIWLEENADFILKNKDESPKKVSSFGGGEIQVFLDSLLVAKQLSGQYKIKNKALQNIAIKVKKLEQDLIKEGKVKKISYHHIPREQNRRADELLNRALDARR